MNSHIRPYIVTENADGFVSNLVDNVNSHNLIGGGGVKIKRNSNNTIISATPQRIGAFMGYGEAYDPTKSYHVNDVVFVDPSVNYSASYGYTSSLNTSDTYVSGSSCPMCPGLFICVKNVPDINADSNLLINTISPLFPGGITSNFADSYRHNNLNIYHPVYPIIPTSSVSYVQENYWYATANDTFWAPLSPMLKTQVCNDNDLITIWLNGVNPSSSFNQENLPYQ